MNPKDEPTTPTRSSVPPASKPTVVMVRCDTCSGRGFTVWGDQNITCGACDGAGSVTVNNGAEKQAS